MHLNVERIEKVEVAGPTSLSATWTDSYSAVVDLTGWIATGGEMLAPLAEERLFATLQLADYGSAVEWNGDDLAIDSTHLRMIAEQQKPLDAEELKRWQESLSLSNREAAGFLKIGLSTWNLYKAGGAIPDVVSMLCRAAERDPVIVEAHLRPIPSLPSGRPKGDGMQRQVNAGPSRK